MSPAQTPRQRFYLPELDGLRFIAFLLVFVHNSPYDESNLIWKELSKKGWVGVDLFFCLSAFLITRLLINEYMQVKAIDIRYFYIRRILRIWPIYFLYVGMIILFNFFSNPNSKLNLGLHIVGLVTFSFNFVYLLLAPYLILLSVHLWTISYEEQFYLIIPWILRKMILMPERQRGGIFVAFFLLFTMVRALFIFFHVKHPAIYMLPFTHFEAMFGGFAIGLGFFDKAARNIKGVWLFMMGILLAFLIFLLPDIYEIDWKLMLTYPLTGIGMTIIVLSIVKSEKSIISNVLRIPILVYLGKISYGLYLFHLAGNLFSGQTIKFVISGVYQSTAYPLIAVIGGLITTALIAIGSYHLIEKPFLKLKENFTLVKSRPI